MDHYFTIEKESQAEFKDRGSKFLGYAYPVETTATFKEILQQLKKEHPKAVHHCFAYRIGLTGDQFRVSDDGEPAGTAGKPILGQIDSKQLVNVGIIVVRYFGGTLLGVPGLIHAYKTVASLCIQTVPIIQKPVMLAYTLQFDYTRMNEVMLVLKQCQCLVLKKDMQLFIYMSISVPQSRQQEVLYRIAELHNVECLALL